MKTKTIEEILCLKPFKELELSEISKQELKKVHDACIENDWKFNNLCPLLQNMISNDVEPEWVERIKRSKTIFGNDSSSLESYINRYGNKGEELWEKKTQKTTNTKDLYIKNHSLDEWEKLCKKKIINNKEVLIERFGEQEAIEKFDTYLRNWKSSIEKKGGWDNGLSLEKMVDRHGLDDGLKKWNEKRDKQRQRFSLSWYQDKYGLDKGNILWTEYKQKMSKISEKNARKNGLSFSKISQKLFWKIAIHLSLNLDEVYFSECNKEKIFKRYKDGKYMSYYSVDFLFKNKIIEFDGDYYHKETLDRDSERDLFFLNKGYQILRIKECDYNNNRIEVFDKCLNFLMK